MMTMDIGNSPFSQAYFYPNKVHYYLIMNGVYWVPVSQESYLMQYQHLEKLSSHVKSNLEDRPTLA